MNIKTPERCMSCQKIISKKRYYCRDCFTDLETKVKPFTTKEDF